MFSNGRKKGTFRFQLQTSNSVKKVCVAGDFSDWEPVRMKKQKNGSYAVTMPLSAGSYQYKFQVNEDWLLDPDNHNNALNSFGSLNSVAEIK
jgi:1,4-alpha-glucan branching enzyme